MTVASFRDVPWKWPTCLLTPPGPEAGHLVTRLGTQPLLERRERMWEDGPVPPGPARPADDRPALVWPRSRAHHCLPAASPTLTPALPH